MFNSIIVLVVVLKLASRIVKFHQHWSIIAIFTLKKHKLIKKTFPFYARFEVLECPRMKNPCLIIQLTHLSVIYTSRCLCTHPFLSLSLSLSPWRTYLLGIFCAKPQHEPPHTLNIQRDKKSSPVEAGTLFAVLDLLFVSILL